MTTIPQLDGLQVPPELFRQARVGKRKEGYSLPPLPFQNPTYAQLAGTPTPYSPLSNPFIPPATHRNPLPNFDPQAGHSIAGSSDLSQRSRRGRPPSRSVEGNSPPFTNASLPYPRGTDAIEVAKMRHATNQGALRYGLEDGGGIASNDNGYDQNGRGKYGVYPGSGGSESFSTASSAMSGWSLPYTPPSNLFGPQTALWNPSSNFDPQAGRPFAGISIQDLPQLNHEIVVELRLQDKTPGVTGECIVQGYDNSEVEHGRLPGRSNTFPCTKFSLPISTKPIQAFLVTTYLVADALASRSTQLPAFRVQIRHLSIQALSLTVRLNDVLDTNGGVTEDQYEEGFDLDK